MASASAIKTKIDKALKKIGPPRKTVIKRVITVEGDTLIGRQTTTVVDATLSPQPYYTELKDKVELLGGKVVNAGDYRLLVSANSITRADLEDPNTVFVLKESTGREEILHLIDYKAPELQGLELLFTVYARKVKG